MLHTTGIFHAAGGVTLISARNSYAEFSCIYPDKLYDIIKETYNIIIKFRFFIITSIYSDKLFSSIYTASTHYILQTEKPSVIAICLFQNLLHYLLSPI